MKVTHNIRMINVKAAILLAAFLIFRITVPGQVTVSLGNLVCCNHTDVHLPVYVSGFNDINAITLQIQVDTLLNSYIALDNPNINLSGGSLIGNISYTNNSAIIIITWYRLSPISIPEGKLLDIVLHYKEGSSPLNFTGNCEIASGLTPVDSVNYINGSINKEPQSVFLAEGETARFSVNHDDESIYFWQCNSGDGWTDLANITPYTGVYSHELIINNIALNFNNNTYRCKINHNGCEIISAPATLMVSPLSINEHYLQPAILNVFPNPNHGVLYFEVDSPLNNVGITILDILGNQIFYSFFHELSDNHIETINTSLLQQGLYLFQLTCDDVALNTVKVIIK